MIFPRICWAMNAVFFFRSFQNRGRGRRWSKKSIFRPFFVYFRCALNSAKETIATWTSQNSAHHKALSFLLPPQDISQRVSLLLRNASRYRPRLSVWIRSRLPPNSTTNPFRQSLRLLHISTLCFSFFCLSVSACWSEALSTSTGSYWCWPYSFKRARMLCQLYPDCALRAGRTKRQTHKPTDRQRSR